jgi:hypothetical protein
MKANGARRPRLNNSRVPGARIVGAHQRAPGFISRGHETGVPTLLLGVSFTASSTLACATGPMVTELRRASDDQVRHCRSSLGHPNPCTTATICVVWLYRVCLKSCGDQISTSDRGVSRRSLTHARPGRREPPPTGAFSKRPLAASTQNASSKTESEQIQLVRIRLSVRLEAMLKVQMGNEFTNPSS